MRTAVGCAQMTVNAMEQAVVIKIIILHAHSNVLGIVLVIKKYSYNLLIGEVQLFRTSLLNHTL